MKAEALIGKVLGTCTLLRLVGQGGMGAVYLAQQSRPRRQVAVKVLLPMTELSPAQHAAFLERFRRETDVAASLIHPNIMPVHEYGEQDGHAYLVMPYISGGTLRDEMELQDPMPLAKILYALEQIAAALDFAHGRGVVHRDVKPANILKTPEGRLLLSDFGLVKIIVDGQTEQSYFSGIDLPLGTPDYMAPEQGLGAKVDARADLYSLGVVLYHMLTGDVPFKGEMAMQIAMQHLHVPPPSPRLKRADLPGEVEQVVLRSLAKNPADRYSSAIAMATAFYEALLSAGIRLEEATMEVSVRSKVAKPAEVARSFKSRSLFDPLWQAEQVKTTGAEALPASGSPVADSSAFSGPVGQGYDVDASLLSHAQAAPISTHVLTQANPAPELAVRFPKNAGGRYTPLPPTPLKLTSKGEGPTMFQKHKMLSPTPKSPEAQAASAPQDAPMYPSAQESEAKTQVPVRPFTSQPAPGTSLPPTFASQHVPGQMGGAQPAPPMNNGGPAWPPASNVPPFSQHPARQSGGTQESPFAPNTTRQLDNTNPPPAFTPTNATRKLSGPPVSTGNTGYFVAAGTTGAYARISTGQTGALMVPNGGYEEQGMTGTMKLTQPVKVVQVPVAGQPGRYMTGFLPVVPSGPDASAAQAQGRPTSTRKKVLLALSLASIVLVLFGSGLFLLLRPHSHQQATTSVGPQGPDASATAMAIASATAQANVILEDPLTTPIHNWPLATSGPLQYIFKDGAYHVIVNDKNNSALPLLPGETFKGPMAYAVTMQEMKGDDGSPYNWFGVVMRYSENQRGGRAAKTFYCFDYEPADGIYQFRMYNSGFAASASAWSDIWHAKRGGEYHTGHGAKNTIKVFANGNDFTFFVNGKRVGEARDNSLANGQIGMVVNQQGAEIAYSDLLLTYN